MEYTVDTLCDRMSFPGILICGVEKTGYFIFFCRSRDSHILLYCVAVIEAI